MDDHMRLHEQEVIRRQREAAREARREKRNTRRQHSIQTLPFTGEVPHLRDMHPLPSSLYAPTPLIKKHKLMNLRTLETPVHSKWYKRRWRQHLMRAAHEGQEPSQPEHSKVNGHPHRDTSHPLKLRILFLSDTHALQMPSAEFFPDAHLCLHTGDFTSHGTLAEIVEFKHWFASLNCSMGRFVVSGNNDFLFHDRFMWRKEDLNALFEGQIQYLRDDTIRVDLTEERQRQNLHHSTAGHTVTGEAESSASAQRDSSSDSLPNHIVIHGAPWLMNNFNQLKTDAILLNKPIHTLTDLSNQFFFLGDELRREKWKLIPEDTNILLTHSPAFGILDKDTRSRHRGCSHLRERISNLPNLDLHLMGHIHGAEGSVNLDDVVRVNGVYLYNQTGFFFEYWI